MTVPSSLINHKQGRQRLQHFLDDGALRLCVISAPADHGKSSLCEWLYGQVSSGGRPASFVQLSTLLLPPQILKSILADLDVGPNHRRNMLACRPSAPVSISLVQGVQIIDSRDVSIDASSKAPSELDQTAHYSDLFDAFVQDFNASGASPGFVLVIDNYEKCDKLVQDWIYTCLLRLAKLLPAIKIVFFCQEFKRGNLEPAIATVSHEYRLGPIVDREEVYDWLREHGQSINDHIVNSVENAFDNFFDKPLVMANALKILLPRGKLTRPAFRELSPP